MLEMRHGRSYYGKPAKNIHTHLRNHPSRKLVATIIQMRTGHGFNKHYLARIPSSSIHSPKCTCGYRRQIPQHLLPDCRLHRTECKALKKHIKPLPLTWQTAMHTGKGLQGTMEFLMGTGVGTMTWVLGLKMTDMGGFGWSHFNGEGREGEAGERGEVEGSGVDVAEVVGVG